VAAPLLQKALYVPFSVKPPPAQRVSTGGNVGDVKVEKWSLIAPPSRCPATSSQAPT